jgi:hypothetical protein
MKNQTIFLLWLLFILQPIYAQKGISFSLSSGLSIPTGEYAKLIIPDKTIDIIGGQYQGIGFTQYTKGGLQFNFDVVYQLNKFGIGTSMGIFSHQINQIDYNMPFSTQIDVAKLSGLYFGIGPQYTIGKGKIKADLMMRGGLMKFNMDKPFHVAYNGDDLGQSPPDSIRTVNLEKSSVIYAATGLKISYDLNKRLQIFTKVDYLIGIDKGLAFKEDYYTPFDITQDNKIDAFDVSHFTVVENLTQKTRYIKPSMLNIGVGLTYNISIQKSNRNKYLDKRHNNKNEQTKTDENNPIINNRSASQDDDDDDNTNSKIYAVTNGEFEITNDQSPDGLYSFTPGQAFSGTGTAYLPFMASTVAVEFENIKVNQQAHLTEGKIIVKHNASSPTYPRDWLLGSIGTQVSNTVSFDHSQVKDLMDWADDQTNTVPSLEFLGTNSLQPANNPAISTPFILELDPNNDSRFAITEMVFLPTKSEFNAVVALDVPPEWNSTEQIGFISKGVDFHLNDIVGNANKAEIVDDILIGNANNKIAFRFKKATGNNHPGCYIQWNENGFQQYGIELETQFTRTWFKPVPDDGTSKSKATFIGVTPNWDDVVLEGNLEKSEIVAGHGMIVEGTDISLDMSDSSNPSSISFSTDYSSLPNTQTDNLWRGFFTKNISVGLPREIQNNQGTPVTVSVDQLLIDNQGITMKLSANDIIEWPRANISDLNGSLDSVSANILAGTLINYEVEGKITIPAASADSIQNPLQYTGYYIPANQVANSTVIPDSLNLTPNHRVLFLTISPTGTIYSDLLKAKIELDPASEFYALKSDSLKYFNMNLQGKLKYENINLVNRNETYSTSNTTSNATGSTTVNTSSTINDHLTIDLEVNFEDLGFKYDSSKPTEKLTFSPPTWSLASPQKKIHDFPISINNIEYESLPIVDDEDLHGQINFDVITNLSSNIGATTGLGLEFEIKNDTLDDKRFNPTFIAAHLDSLAVDANLAAVKINGYLYIKNDSIYGKGFGGGLSAVFKGIDLSVNANGQFGTTVYNNNNHKYRYWQVDAGVDFSQGIPFLPSLAIYGFKGGACRNMLLNVDTSDPTNITRTYIPDNANLGFKAGLTIGTTPLVDSFNADVAIEGVFSTNSGGMQYLGFTGNYATNAKIDERRNGKGKINGNLDVHYDYPTKHFYLGADASIHASPITTPNPIWLAYDIDGLQNNWYFKCGEPDYTGANPNLNTVNINLSNSGSGVNLYEYFMFGNSLPEVGGFTNKFKNKYAAKIGNAPGFESNVSNISEDGTSKLGTGMALGLGFEVDKSSDKHIKGYFYLNYGLTAGAEVNLSYMRYPGSCGNFDPIGINSWRAKGSVGLYATALAEVERRKPNKHKTWTIADLRGGAWVQAEFPNPYYVKGAVEGAVKIGCVNNNNNCLVNRTVHVDFEKGTQCNNSPNNVTPQFEQQYATDEFNNDLIKYIAPSNNYNFSETAPLAVKYNFEPNDEFVVSEQQADGSVRMRVFKMKTRVYLKEQKPNGSWTDHFLEHRINNIGEYQYRIAQPVSVNVSASQNALNTLSQPTSSNPMVANAVAYQNILPGSPNNNNTAIVNQNMPFYSLNMMSAAAITPIYSFPPPPQPYLNTLKSMTTYKFIVVATMKELNHANGHWEDALNTDGTMVQETVSKVFRTGPMPPAYYQYAQ